MKVLRKDEEDWWYARHSDGRCGSIPVPYIEIVSGVLGGIPYPLMCIVYT